MTTVSKADFEALIDKYFNGKGYIKDMYTCYSDQWRNPCGVHCLFVVTSSKGINYDGLVAMTKLVGTEDIDINSWSEFYAYSEETWEEDDGLTFRFKVSEVKIVIV